VGRDITLAIYETSPTSGSRANYVVSIGVNKLCNVHK